MESGISRGWGTAVYFVQGKSMSMQLREVIRVFLVDTQHAAEMFPPKFCFGRSGPVKNIEITKLFRNFRLNTEGGCAPKVAVDFLSGYSMFFCAVFSFLEGNY